jgi:alpha-mannosidase
VAPGDADARPSGSLQLSATGLSNDYLRIKLDNCGRFVSVYDKIEEREVLAPGQKGNVLQLFEDRPAANDAWDIDHNVRDTGWEPGKAESIEVLERGPVRGVVRVVRKTEKSTITQDITLHALLPRVDVVTYVDWHEKHALLEVAFPVDVLSHRAAFDIQFATVERATHNNTDFDFARAEVTAQQWADLSEGDYGVSLLNDCKYSYNVKDNVLRLSLLRSPVDPDPKADEGQHLFTYSLFPHGGDWRYGTVQQAKEFNDPLVVTETDAVAGAMPKAYAFASVDADNVIVDTVKKAEDGKALIVRLYEAYGQRGEVTLTFGNPPKKITECDLMEENDTPVALHQSSVAFQIKPYEIRTFKVVF